MSNSNFDNLRDTQPYTPQPYQTFDNPPPPRRFPWGCLIGGCGVITVVLLVVICGCGFWLYSTYQTQLAKYTSESPLELPSANIGQDETDAITQKLKDFRTEFEAGEAPQELEISIDEINALIASNPAMKGHVYVSIEDQMLKAQVSIPTDELPLGGEGRFFNGSATLKVELVNGNLIVTVVDADANGNPIPEAVMQEMRKQNLAKGMYENPETARTLQRCESLEIKPDRIILKVRQKKPVDKASSEDSSESKAAEDSPEVTKDSDTFVPLQETSSNSDPGRLE